MTAYAPPLGETIFAQRGRFERRGDDRARIVLEDGVFLMPVQGQLSQVRFEQLDQEIELDASSVHVVDPISAESAASAVRDGAHRRRAARAARGARPSCTRASRCRWRRALFGWLAVPLLLARGSRVSRAGGAALGSPPRSPTTASCSSGTAWRAATNIPVAAAVWLPNALLALLRGLAHLARARAARLRESLRTRLAGAARARRGDRRRRALAPPHPRPLRVQPLRRAHAALLRGAAARVPADRRDGQPEVVHALRLHALRDPALLRRAHAAARLARAAARARGRRRRSRPACSSPAASCSACAPAASRRRAR